MHKDRESAIAGTLLGTALGDALGLACEGMGADAIARRFGRIDDFHILGRTGFVSDDTEQSALVAQSLARSEDLQSCRRAFRRAMLGWFLRLPWGIGLGTIRACFKIALGLRRSGVMSAGNGAAMRAGVVGAVFADDAAARQAYGRAMAEVTHRDARAVDGALFVAELTALSVGAPSGEDRGELVERALGVVHEQSLRGAIKSALAKARDGASAREAGDALGTSGFVIHSVPMATYAFVRFGSEPSGRSPSSSRREGIPILTPPSSVVGSARSTATHRYHRSLSTASKTGRSDRRTSARSRKRLQPEGRHRATRLPMRCCATWRYTRS